MSRVQLALNVEDLDAAVEFYGKLFDAKPAKLRPGYANFAIEEPALKLVLIAGEGKGGTLAWLLVHDWQRVFVEAYTQLLLLKIAIVGSVCVIALLNKVSLTPRLAEANIRARVRLQQNIRLELLLLRGVVAVTSVLAVTAPTAHETDHNPPPVEAVLVAEQYELRIHYTPAPNGEMQLNLGRNGEPVEAMEITLQWRQPDGNTEALRRPAQPTDAGFESTLPPLAVESWDLEADILIDDFTSLTVSGRIEMR